MSSGRRALFWILAIALFVGALLLFQPVLLPFVAGMVVAYFLDPVTDRLETVGLGRTLATSLVLTAFFLLGAIVLLLILPMLQAQLTGLIELLPKAVTSIRDDFLPWLQGLTDSLSEEQSARIEQAFSEVSGRAADILVSLVGEVWASGVALLNMVGLLVITPIVAWYLLRDWDRMVARVDGWLPRDHAEIIRAQMREVDQTLAGFVRGQATVCVILGTSYAIALELVGLNYGLIVGLIAGLISFIPYVGSIVGFTLSMGLAIAQFGVSLMVLAVAAIFFAGQAIEGNFLTPKLVGGRVGLHPVWVMFALLAGGSLFGFLGVLIAVPVAAVIGVVTRFALAQYLGSPLYAGERRDGP